MLIIREALLSTSIYLVLCLCVQHVVGQNVTLMKKEKMPNMEHDLTDTLIDSEWITVVTVSKWYDDMFQNWLFWYNLLELDMRVILIAEDRITFEKYAKNKSLQVLSTGLL